MTDFGRQFIVEPGTKVDLADRDAAETGGIQTKKDARKALKASTARLAELQEVLWAENKHALLIILQAMDAGGKDGTIRHVMSGVNPQGCRVASFKVPTPEELDHDFLWRIHKAVPGKGEIGIFNRSHYEDVLVARVRNLVARDVWEKRYDAINAFERILSQDGITILKFFLHVSRKEQKKRLLKRISDPRKNWKVRKADFDDRRFWDDYTAAYEQAIRRCSTEWAPWYIIPADKKWFRNLAVSRIVVETLEGLNMEYPPAPDDISEITVR